MNLRECYEKFGGDYDDTLSRMMTDAFVERFMIKFLDDKTFDSVRAAVDTGNVPELFRGVHTMKGVAGNLGFTRLRDASSALTEHLRGRDDGDIDGELVRNFMDAYHEVVDAVNEYIKCKER